MNKELLHTKVERRIISLIASGVYKRGRRLPAERKLCEQFDISRGTLRKAMDGLEKMRVISIEPQSGAYVRKFSQKKIPGKIAPLAFNGVTLPDIITARRAIEVPSVESACKNIKKTQLNKLQTILKNMEASINDLPKYIKLDTEFHELIVRASGNPALIIAFEAMADYHRYSHIFSSGTQGQEASETFKTHKKIFQYLKRGNKKQSVNALQEHFDNILASQ